MISLLFPPSLILVESGGQLKVGFVFWFLMLFWFILGLIWGRSFVGPDRPYFYGGGILLFTLLCLLGYGIFGFPFSGN